MFEKAVPVSNPGFFKLNEISVGVINTDVLKDFCNSIIYKKVEAGKIDQGLKMILEQRCLYPIYPQPVRNRVEDELPIDYSQIENLMLNEEYNPDIIITPSDLNTFAKVS